MALDIEGRVRLWNHSAEKIFGWSSEEVLGKPLPTIPEAEKSPLSKEARESLSGEVHLQKPCRRLRKDGTLLEVTLSTAPLCRSDGSIYGTVGFLLDVTETRKTEKQLEQTHNLLQATFAGMDEAVFVVDPKERTIVTANPAMERIFGYSPEEVIGRNTAFLHPDPEAYEEWNRVGAPELERHGVARREWLMRRKNGELFWAEITVRPISGHETWQQGVVSVIRDISERKAYTEELNRKSRELAERVKELNCLFAVADLLNDPHSSLEHVLQSVVDALPPGFRFPRSACARLTLDGRIYTSENFKETSRCLTSRFQSDQSKGLIEVCYREKTPAEAEGSFLEEERRMLDGVAERVGSFVQRREAIAALRAVRKRLQHLLTASPGIIFSASVTPPYQTTFISENVRDILGYKPTQFIEDPEFWIGQIHPQDQSRIKNALKDVSPDKTARNEYRFQHSDGSWRWILDFSRLMTDEEGHPVEYIGSLVDITQRKKAEEKTRRLSEIIEATPDFVGTSDVEGQPEFINPAGRRMVGLDPRENLTKLKMEALHPPWAIEKLAEQGLPAAVETGYWRGESALLSSNGKEIPVSQLILAHGSEDGKTDYFSTIMQDISYYKTAEAEMRRLNQTLRMVSRCNEALVRAEDEKELLESILRHLVESGGYALAMVWYSGHGDDYFPPVIYPEKAAGFLAEKEEEGSPLVEHLSRICPQPFTREIPLAEELFPNCPECGCLTEIFDVHSTFALALNVKDDHIGCL
ncbi:MAG TPA: PAS domain S-box protein, partial [Desulfuromonadales bacterium]|nr:PAS domain S-box protein [Desulfuromonadales bacterium]